VSGPPSGAQVVVILKMAYELYVKNRADNLRSTPCFASNPLRHPPIRIARSGPPRRGVQTYNGRPEGAAFDLNCRVLCC